MRQEWLSIAGAAKTTAFRAERRPAKRRDLVEAIKPCIVRDDALGFARSWRVVTVGAAERPYPSGATAPASIGKL